MDRVDVAVVGGGPAGASAAHAAALDDASTTVIEKGVPREDRDALGPDSTDAAALINYWLDLMELDPTDIPDDIVLRELERAEFNGPTEQVVIEDTGIEATYSKFGLTFDRARFDDWLVERAQNAGATYVVGDGVRTVKTDLAGEPTHEVILRSGERIVANHLVLADGPQRTVTLDVLDRFLPADKQASDLLATPRANHIAYQEYRRFPEGEMDPEVIRFWWGHIPGHTAYAWVFPNDGNVARVGLTMPIGVDLDGITDRDRYRLIRDDEQMPTGRKLIRRLLEQEYGDTYDIESDFPLVNDRGKDDGTETYPISSTRPVDSPVEGNVAVTGGAMGATSAFHEGGTHVAVRSGAIAGRLAARGELDRYNDTWKAAIGLELRRNAALAAMVRGYEPADWDKAFATASGIVERGGKFDMSLRQGLKAIGLEGLSVAGRYMWHMYRFKGDRLPQITASDYRY